MTPDRQGQELRLAVLHEGKAPPARIRDCRAPGFATRSTPQPKATTRRRGHLLPARFARQRRRGVRWASRGGGAISGIAFDSRPALSLPVRRRAAVRRLHRVVASGRSGPDRFGQPQRSSAAGARVRCAQPDRPGRAAPGGLYYVDLFGGTMQADRLRRVRPPRSGCEARPDGDRSRLRSADRATAARAITVAAGLPPSGLGAAAPAGRQADLRVRSLVRWWCSLPPREDRRERRHSSRSTDARRLRRQADPAGAAADPLAGASRALICTLPPDKSIRITWVVTSRVPSPAPSTEATAPEGKTNR